MADAVYAEQVAGVFRQMPIALAINFVNAALTALVLAPLATRPLPLPWFVAITIVTLGRGILWLRYRGSAVRPEDVRRWSRRATTASLLTGLCWGVGGAVLFPVVPVLGQIFLTIVIGGMCAGAVVISASYLPTLVAFLLAASLPMAARFFAEGTAPDHALGAMIVLFAAALWAASWRLNRTFTETMRLRFVLDETNRRLQAEIAEHRATEASLRQAQKLEAIGQLTGGIAHDFNNLLTVIVGNLQLASARADSAAIEPFLRAAQRAAQRGGAQIQQLLGFARNQRLDPRSLDLPRLIFGIEQLLRRTLGPEIDLVILADPDVAPAHADANQLELAILNLTINARHAMPAGGTMRVAIENRRAGLETSPELTPGDYVVLSISDNGTGMDEATLAHAVDPFFTTKDIGSGSGLGLPMVQGFAAQSGGAIAIRSKLGEGTTVDLWLPQADEPPAREERERTVVEIGRGAASIVLCDDDEDVRHLLSAFLNSVGYTVHEASGSEAAIAIVESETAADLLIVDYAMPGMNGLEIIGRARLRRPGLRALLITGYAGAPTGSGVPLLRKPFTPDELARRVAEILAA